MKILVLENNPGEFALIQQALHNNRDVVIPLASSEEIWPYIRSGESHFLIANWDTSDLRHMQFIPRVRAMKIADPFIILLITEMNSDDELAPTGADDVIQKPFSARDLKNRVAMAARIISLSNNLISANDQLESQAVYDPLTGFMNRSGFFRQSNGELERARRASLPLSLIALDIDNFKLINGKFGAKIGDDVLRMAAQVVREKSRPYDCIGRWMGDEFIIMLAGVIGADAEKIAERVIAGVRGTHVEIQNEPPVMVKISAGIASAAHISASTEVEPLIQQARQAMARAKESGGNQVFLIYV
ncbi:MAG: diguanylate cyclase [Chloroflexi bacterium]|nr:diguanylate cyclase [Chloroflexota bacterium]